MTPGGPEACRPGQDPQHGADALHVEGLSWHCGDSAEADYIQAEIFGKECYAPPCGPPPPGGVVVDAGANIGLFSLYAVTRWQARRVLAVEPAPPLLDLLRRNLAAHDLSRIEVVPAALSDAGSTTGDEARLTYFPAAPGNSTLRPADKDAEIAALPPRTARRAAALMDERVDYPVRLTTLSAVLDEHAVDHVDLLKIDVEGEEEAVLRGVCRTWWPRIDTVVVEVSHHGCGVSAVTRLIEEQGFEVWVADADPARTITALVWGHRSGQSPT
ncbi:FkbM family methyltransferase [Nonomuraea sp. NPDC049419]|uniref:FkbM family methyltransferase n=1 Tax=Nonomuraea sp. NPDC049419 TaxID=3155772 RepID=UPI003428AC48